MSFSPNLALPYIDQNQSQKHVTHNLAIRELDAIVQLSVIDDALTAPPGSPVDGDRYIVAASPTGAWAGQAGKIAAWQDGAWSFYTPRTGFFAFIISRSFAYLYVSGAWVPLVSAIGTLAGLAGVGILSTADATNRLSVKSNAALFTHDDVTPGTGDMRFTLNKASGAKTVSQLYQSNWSGRAETGLTGDDNFHIKISADGATWRDALKVYCSTGVVDFPQAFTAPVRPNIVQRNWLTSQAWLSSSSAADYTWRAVCWARELGLWVAVSVDTTSNNVMTSPDGVTWTAHPAVNGAWWSVCWSRERRLLVAVANSGTSNRVMTSPDGVNWTLRADTGTGTRWTSVCWARELGLFVAVANGTGSGNRVMTSPDGITWTVRTSAEDNSWYSVTWAPELGLLVAVASDGANRVMTSPDGVTWTARPAAAANQWRAVCWARELGLFVAVASNGAGNRVMTSPDGVTWTVRTSAEDNQWYGVAWAPEIGLLVAVAIDGTNRVMTSPDGVTWTARPAAAANQWYGVDWAPELGLFGAVAASGAGNRVMTSKSAYSYSYR